jgi:hypothetical protein
MFKATGWSPGFKFSVLFTLESLEGCSGVSITYFFVTNHLQTSQHRTNDLVMLTEPGVWARSSEDCLSALCLGPQQGRL